MRLLFHKRGAGAVPSWPVPSSKQRRILIHTGLHKTGTTALQNFLSSGSGELRKQNVLYPLTGRPAIAPVAHHNLAWQLAGDRRFRTTAGTLDDVAAEISAFSGDAILSSEDFEGVLGSPLRLTPLLHHPLLSEHAFTLLSYVRDQVSYLESLFFEMLKHGLAIEAHSFCEMVLKYGRVWYQDWTFCFDYHALYDSLTKLPAQAVIRPYVGFENGGIVADFLTFTGLVIDAGEQSPQQRVNEKQTLPEALAFFLQHRLDQGVECCELLTGMLEGRSSHLSSPMRSVLKERFTPGNCRLARECGFSTDALRMSTSVPSAALCLERLFSLQTQTVFSDHGDQSLAEKHLTRFLTGSSANE